MPKFRLSGIGLADFGTARYVSGFRSQEPTMESSQIIGLKISGYEIVEELGSGTSTVSYLACNAGGKYVVVKRLIDALANDESIVTKFLGASDLSGKIRSKKFIAIITGQKKSPEGVFILREHIEGQPLSHYIKKGLLNELNSHKLSCDLCDAVRAISLCGVVHGGIHPDNIIVTTAGRVKLTDFATGAYSLRQKIGKQYRRTALSYLAPEQWRGDAFDSQADIYSAGLVIATLMTGAQFFDANDPDSLKKQVFAGAKIDCPVIAAAIDPNPARRYPEISKFRSGLDGLKRAGDESKEPSDDDELAKKKKAAEKQQELLKREQERKAREAEEHQQAEKKRLAEEARQREEQRQLENQKREKTEKISGTGNPQSSVKKSGTLKAIHDIIDGSKDLLAKPPPYLFTMPKNGRRSQRPLQLFNSGAGPLTLSANCHGNGISISNDQLEFASGQMQPVIITLEPDSDEWVNVAFRWTENRKQHEVELKFYRPG